MSSRLVKIIGYQNSMDNARYPKTKCKQATQDKRTDTTGGQNGKWRKYDAEEVAHNDV
jgi:hypothetical protein